VSSSDSNIKRQRAPDPFQADLRKYPGVGELHCSSKTTTLTFGDLHANSLKFVYQMLHHGVIEMSEDDYNLFVSTYEKFDARKVTAKDMLALNACLKGITLSDAAEKNDVLLRLIGDELADRGANDWITLKLLERLHHLGLPFEILLSNHGVEFIGTYERIERSKVVWYFPDFLRDFARSLQALQDLVDDKLIDQKEIRQLVETIYKPAIKALSYSIDRSGKRPKITVFSHAPIESRVIEALAEYCGVDFNDDSVDDLATTIEKINSAFYEKIIAKNIVGESCYHGDPPWKGQGRNEYRVYKHPLAVLTWYRLEDSVDFSKESSEDKVINQLFAFGGRYGQQEMRFDVNYAFGHTPKEEVRADIYIKTGKILAKTKRAAELIALDQPFGKYELTGKYAGIYFDERSELPNRHVRFINTFINETEKQVVDLNATKDKEKKPFQNTSNDATSKVKKITPLQSRGTSSLFQIKPKARTKTTKVFLNKLTKKIQNKKRQLQKKTTFLGKSPQHPKPQNSEEKITLETGP
jgi:hypothetical protein